ncbi:MAG: AI-2E family transporter [Gammaproteobacteria bacterium]|nr:AI-2E family transporter [Gammaproteobacteria bacterium]
MKQSAPFIVPFLLSVFIAVISFPLMSKLQQTGLPKGLALSLVMLLVVAIGVALTILIGSSVTDFGQMMPEYQQKISAEWAYIFQWLSDRGFSVADTIKETIDPAAAVGLVSSILKGFGNVLTNSFLILITVVFILMEAADITQKLLVLYGDDSSQQSPDEKTFAQVFVEKLRDYMSMKTIISMITGIVISIALWLIGVDYPVLWGVLAFMLNFVPNIGSIIAAVPAVLLTIVQLGPMPALLVAAVYVAVNVIIGSVVEPKYMGKELGLSTLVVFVSLVFWGWVLGPVGMLLSVPLTITVKLALDSKSETQWLGHLLGPIES